MPQPNWNYECCWPYTCLKLTRNALWNIRRHLLRLLVIGVMFRAQLSHFWTWWVSKQASTKWSIWGGGSTEWSIWGGGSTKCSKNRRRGQFVQQHSSMTSNQELTSHLVKRNAERAGCREPVSTIGGVATWPLLFHVFLPLTCQHCKYRIISQC